MKMYIKARKVHKESLILHFSTKMYINAINFHKESLILHFSTALFKSLYLNKLLISEAFLLFVRTTMEREK